MDKYRQWAQKSQQAGPAAQQGYQSSQSSVGSRQNQYNQGYDNRQNQPYQTTGFGQSTQGNNQAYVDNRQKASNQSNSYGQQSNGGSNSINQQMEALQLRMQHARQENVAARQRVANQSIQGANNDYIRKPDPVNGPLNDNRRNSRRSSGGQDSNQGSSNQQFDNTSSKEQNNSNVDNNVPKELLRDKDEIEPLLTAANLIDKGIQEATKPLEKPLETVEDLRSNTSRSNISSPLKTKRKIKKEKIPVEPSPDPVVNPYMQELLSLAEKTTKTIDDNKDVLGETNEARKQKEKEQSAEFIEERRMKLRELLALKLLDGDTVRLPMWRHKLNGEFDPPDAHVFKGKLLFQVIVKSMIVMFIHPMFVVKRRRIDMRDRERVDLARTMTLYADATKAWLGKCVKAPLATLEQDATLDFEPRPYPLEESQMFQHRMMQLKVRIKCIMQGLTSAEMPADNITDFLITLIDEDNYFPEDYLYEYEIDRMEFNSLGGAVRLILPFHGKGTLIEKDSPDKNVIRALENEFDIAEKNENSKETVNPVDATVPDTGRNSSASNEVKTSVDVERKNSVASEMKSSIIAERKISVNPERKISIVAERKISIVPERRKSAVSTVDIESNLKKKSDDILQESVDDYRNDMIIDKNIVSIPGNDDKFDINRARMLLQNFLLIRILVGQVMLSPWEASICRKPSKRVGKVVYNCRVAATIMYDIVQRCDESYHSSGSNNLPVIGGNTYGGGAAISNPVHEHKRMSVTGGRNSVTGGRKSVTSAYYDAMHAKNNLSYFSKFKNIFFKPLQQDEAKNNLENLRSDIESKLLIKRKPFESLTDLHGYLLKPLTMKQIKVLNDQWIHEYAESLDIWFTKILMHVLIRRDIKMKENGKKRLL